MSNRDVYACYSIDDVMIIVIDYFALSQRGRLRSYNAF